MDERAIATIRNLPREQLESFAIRAAVYIKSTRNELKSREFFLAMLTGFLVGSVVAALGFLVGTALG